VDKDEEEDMPVPTCFSLITNLLGINTQNINLVQSQLFVTVNNQPTTTHKAKVVFCLSSFFQWIKSGVASVG
jgi:hypothetical protein